MNRLDPDAFAQTREDHPSPRDAWKDQEGFNIFALGDWLELCRDAQVPYLPAEKMATTDLEFLLRWDEHPDDPEITAFFDTVEAAKQPFTMLRWDACAPEFIKHRLSKGQAEWNQEILDRFSIDDPRAYDILYEYPDRDVSVWRRPWMPGEQWLSYPIEYRVFVHDGKVRGVSNYYPQRPLAADGEPHAGVQDDVHTAIGYARKLAEALPTPVRFGPAAKRFAPDSRSFTVDFVRFNDGGLAFLEGGPPFGAGAHPCCFPADPGEWSKAVAWSLGGIPVALENQGPERF